MWMAENPDARLKTGGAGRNRAQRMIRLACEGRGTRENLAGHGELQ